MTSDIKTFVVPTFFEEYQPTIKKEVLMENKGFVLYDVFSKEECDWLMDLFDNSDYCHVKDDPNDNYDKNYRDNYRTIQDSNNLSEIIYDRIKNFIQDDIIIDDTNEDLTNLGLTNYYCYNGLWKKKDLNYRFRLCKYGEGGHFAKHFDSDYVHPSELYKSFKTCMLYLNDNYDGGETIFYENDEEIVKLKPKMGMILIFNHFIEHKGEYVTNGEKYIIRSEVMYKKIEDHNKDKDILDFTNINDDAIKSKRYYEKASQLEGSGKPHDAIKYYKIAEKLHQKKK